MAVSPNDATIAILVENHKKFQHFLAKRLGNTAVAEELLQQSLKKAVEHPPEATENASVTAWFYRILKNTLIDYYRSSASENKKISELAEMTAHLGLDSTKAFDDIQAGICECLNDLLPTLKENYAEVIKLVDLQNESIEAVANKLGVTPNNLMVRLHRARQALRDSLEQACGTCTEHGCLHCTCE